MSKLKENGLTDYGPIELVDEPSDMVKVESPELELAKQVFCMSWPAILVYLLLLKAKIKNPIFRWLCGTGLSIIDGLHDTTCKPV